VVLRLGALSVEQLRQVLGTTTLHDSPAARDAALEADRPDGQARTADGGAAGADGARPGADQARLVGSVVPSGVTVPGGALRRLTP
jgi:hypothetical protein